MINTQICWHPLSMVFANVVQSSHAQPSTLVANVKATLLSCSKNDFKSLNLVNNDTQFDQLVVLGNALKKNYGWNK
jgi:hypothetical protein